MNVFDIIGPVMVGPSSSHTLGALKIGRLARKLLNGEPAKAVINLHGSFARTYRGHGTDKAIIAGLLGFSYDDARIKDSLEIAARAGFSFMFCETELENVHPNSVLIEVRNVAGKKISLIGSSIGGGRILIKQINGIDVEFDGEYHTLVISHKDAPGEIAVVTDILGKNDINVANMRVYRNRRGGGAFMIIETDEVIDGRILSQISAAPLIYDLTYIEPD